MAAPFEDTFEVLSYDQRGLGQTEVPEGPYTMADYADDAAALLDLVGWDACAVVGISFGGMVAQELAIRHPDRVRRLALCCTSSGGAGGASYPLQELADMDPADGPAAHLALMDTRWDDAWRAANPDLAAMIIERFASSAASPGPGQRLQLEARSHHDTSDRLGTIALPHPGRRGPVRRDRPARQQRVPGPLHPRCHPAPLRRRPRLLPPGPRGPAGHRRLPVRHRRPVARGQPVDSASWTRRPPPPGRRCSPTTRQSGQDLVLRQLFADDPGRGERLNATAANLVLDYSKQRVTDETMSLLIDVAKAAGVEARRDAMFAGEHINTTEDRAVLHVALRMPATEKLTVDGQDVTGDVHKVLDKMGDLSERVRDGHWVGATGQRIRAVVNIGIGGSDLGPAMATEALADEAMPGLTSRFVSNVDPVDLYAATHDLDPATTLFVISSKTFTTLETLTNAAAARDWLLAGPRRQAPATTPWPSTSSPCRPTPRPSPSSASTPTTCSSSGTGSAAATATTRPSALRS